MVTVAQLVEPSVVVRLVVGSSPIIRFPFGDNFNLFIMKTKVILERFPYRYVEVGVLDNGHPDYRIQKADSYTKRYSDMYLLDNQMQLLTAMEDFNYTLWLDPDNVPSYQRDIVKSM